MPTLTSGFSDGRGRRLVGAVAPVVVGVHVEQDERAALGQGVEPRREGVVEGVVRRQAALEELVGQLAVAPHVEPPAVVGLAVDRLATGPVEVGLEAGARGHHAVGDDRGEPVGERVLLAEALGLVEHHRLGDLGPQLVPRVHRRSPRPDRPIHRRTQQRPTSLPRQSWRPVYPSGHATSTDAHPFGWTAGWTGVGLGHADRRPDRCRDLRRERAHHVPRLGRPLGGPRPDAGRHPGGVRRRPRASSSGSTTPGGRRCRRSSPTLLTTRSYASRTPSATTFSS